MTHRATVIIRASHRGGHRRRGLRRRRGRDAAPRSSRSSATRSRPRLLGQDAIADRALLGARLPGRRSTSCATAASAWWRSPCVDTADLGRGRQGARPAALAALGRLPRPPAGDHHRRLLRRRDGADRRARSPSYREMGLAGCKFKVGGATPETRRGARGARRARRPATTSSSRSTPTRATPRARRSTSADACDGARHPLVRGAVPLAQRPPRDARRARCAAASRSAPARASSSPSGCRDLMEAGAIDVCNFDASWSGGPTEWRRMAALAHAYDVEMGHHEEPQVAAHLLASQPARHVRRVLPPRPRPVLVEPDRQPAGARRRRICRCPTGPGLGWELDWDYIEHHRVDR